MRDWLSRLLPAGRWHDPLVDLTDTAFHCVLILLVFAVVRWILLRSLRLVLRPFMARAERDGGNLSRFRTLEGLARSVISYLLLFIAAISILDQVGINVATLVAGAGVAGLALSFGAQRLVRDVLTGFFLLLEDQFRVDEMVTLVLAPGLPQMTGTIQEMGLRVTRMKDLSGKLVTLGNGDITAVINHHRGPVTATVDVALAPEAELSRVSEVLAALELPAELFSGPARLDGVTALEAGKRVVRLAAPATPGMGPEAELALRRQAGEALVAAGIELR